MRQAANALILQCAANSDSRGGIAHSIGEKFCSKSAVFLVDFEFWINGGAGGDNQLSVVLGVYEPDVQCRGTIDSSEWGSCRDILVDMPAGQHETKFGPGSDPSVQVPLPFHIDSCKLERVLTTCYFFGFNLGLVDKKCLMTMFSTGDSDYGYWYRMWEVVTAVFCICARAGKGGSARGLGE